MDYLAALLAAFAFIALLAIAGAGAIAFGADSRTDRDRGWFDA